MIVYINDKKLDLEASKPIAVTKQVNDIGNLSNRQNDFSQKIKAPFTSHNKQILSGLATLGSASQIPYQNNTAKIFDNNGNAVIANGFAVVRETTKEYEIVIYQGILNLFKTLANTNLKDIGLPALNHIKNVPSIVNTWDNELDYVYLIANYNGRLFVNSNFNADFLIPSAYVSYIWNRIFEYAGYTYAGSTFDTPRFKNLCITYPKGVGSLDTDVELAYERTFTVQTFGGFNPPPFNTTIYRPYLFQGIVINNFFTFLGDGERLSVIQDGIYRFEISGTINFPVNLSANYNIKLNGEILLQNITNETQIDLQFTRDLEINDILFLTYQNGNSNDNLELAGASNLLIKIFKVSSEAVDFEQAFIDFKSTDFLKEIMIKFGLTPYVSETQNHFDFLTEDERLQIADSIDISNKFIEKTKEVYQIGYAQRNFFKYKYNDTNETHFDGFIDIENPNLPEERTVFQSQTFAPLNRVFRIQQKRLDILPLWEAEVQDDGTHLYNSLDKRFYFLEVFNFGGTINLESPELNQTQNNITNAKWGRFINQRFNEILKTNYRSTKVVLNNANITTALMWLNALDLQKLKLQNNYYIKQLGGNFIINKIINFVPNVPTRVELLKINTKELFLDEVVIEDFTLEIFRVKITDCVLTLDLETNIPQPFIATLVANSTNINPITGLPNVSQTTQVIIDDDLVSRELASLPNGDYKFTVIFSADTTSQESEIINNTCFEEPLPNEIILTGVQTISISGNNRTVKVLFTTDIVLPTNFDILAVNNLDSSDTITNAVTPSVNEFTFVLPHLGAPPLNALNSWRIFLKKGTTTSNPIDSNG